MKTIKAGTFVLDEDLQEAHDFLDSRIEPEPMSGCHLYTGSTNPGGYGSLFVGHRPDRLRKMAHRISYERAYGPIPAGLVVDHLCGNKVCVNPDHLEAVTQKENLRRSREKRGCCADS